MNIHDEIHHNLGHIPGILDMVYDYRIQPHPCALMVYEAWRDPDRAFHNITCWACVWVTIYRSDKNINLTPPILRRQ